LEHINAAADRLNSEAAEVLEYQAPEEWLSVGSLSRSKLAELNQALKMALDLA